MFERKEAIINNKRYFISQDYIRKVFEPTRSKTSIKSKDDNSDFKRIETIQKINISNEHPKVLFHKPNNKNMYSIENKIKKDLIENKGYLNDGGYKKKLLKYYSYHNTDQSNSKNIFRSTISQNKSSSKNNENKNFFNSNRTSFSMGINKRTIQKDYSDSIKKLNRKLKIKKENKEENNKGNNRLLNSVNLHDVKYRNLLIKKLVMKNVAVNLFRISKNNTENKKKENDYQRKKYCLENYDNVNEKEKNKDSNVKNKNKKKLYNNNNNNNHNINSNNRNTRNNIDFKDYNYYRKKRYKEIVKPLEFIHKIKKELNILRKSKEKDKK